MHLSIYLSKFYTFLPFCITVIKKVTYFAIYKNLYTSKKINKSLIFLIIFFYKNKDKNHKKNHIPKGRFEKLKYYDITQITNIHFLILMHSEISLYYEYMLIL